MGVVAMIAVPRMSNAAHASYAASLRANIRILNNAADAYAVEHNGLSPAHMSDGSVTADESLFAKRLTHFTDESGDADGIFGPYLLRIPVNPVNKLDTVRIDGPAPGENLAGWRFDTTRLRFMPDHLRETAAARLLDQDFTSAVAARAAAKAGLLGDGGALEPDDDGGGK